MKFELTKSGKFVELRIHESGKPVRQEDIFIEGRVYVQSKPPSKEYLNRIINLQCDSNAFQRTEVFSLYQHSMSEKIKEETKKMMQSYLKIKNAIKCIDIAQEIELSEKF